MAGGHPRKRTALIVTVRNEVESIEALLESIACQTVSADDVVVADGGSTDGTLDVLRRWCARLPLTIVEAPGANIARGRNVAITASSGELIAVTDAGVRLEPDWLERLTEATWPDVDVVSGFFKADTRTPFEKALGATTLPSLEDVKPERFLPSSRSVLFRRTVWEQVGGYPEWLDYCEDLVFDLALRRAGSRFVFEPRAVVWFRPRRSLGAFFWQYFLYARGDGKAGLWPLRHAIRFGTYAVAAVSLVWWRKLIPLVLVGAVLYCRRPAQRLQSGGVRVIARVPMIRLVGDVAKMLGYPVGVLWRIQNGWTSRSSS